MDSRMCAPKYVPRNLKKEITDENRKELRKQLEKCTVGQIGRFNQMYGSIDTIPDDKVLNAILQVNASIKHNIKKYRRYM